MGVLTILGTSLLEEMTGGFTKFNEFRRGHAHHFDNT